jgi:hypothetical protein
MGEEEEERLSSFSSSQSCLVIVIIIYTFVISSNGGSQPFLLLVKMRLSAADLSFTDLSPPSPSSLHNFTSSELLPFEFLGESSPTFLPSPNFAFLLGCCPYHVWRYGGTSHNHLSFDLF